MVKLLKKLGRCTSRGESSGFKQPIKQYVKHEAKWHSSTTLGGERIFSNHRFEVHICMYIFVNIHVLFKDDYEGNSG